MWERVESASFLSSVPLQCEQWLIDVEDNEIEIDYNALAGQRAESAALMEEMLESSLRKVMSELGVCVNLNVAMDKGE